MMSSQAVYCLSLQIQPNENGKNSTNSNSTKNEVTTTTTATTTTKNTFESLQLQHQQQQQQTQQLQQTIQQPHQQLTNNIILLRGSRNENGQIIIQNKHDIISFINEQQQQQQQHQQQQQQIHDKTTAATLATQLPTTTTIARKIQSGISVVATTAAGNGGNAKESTSVAASTPTASNTILLQTPINASQLESVLLQSSSNMKKSSTTLNERSFLIKNSSRSLSTDSNRISNTDSKGPFVLQTLKRLEKSQSILVIRNSSSSSVNSASTSSAASSFKASSNNDLTNSCTPTTATVSTNTGSAPQGALVNNTINNNNNSNNNNSTTSLSFTRTSKGHHQQQQQTKLANIIANRTAASLLSSTSSSALSTTLSSLKASSAAGGATTTTTFLRLGSNTTVAAAAAAFANKNKSNKANNTNSAGAGSNNYNNNNNNNSHQRNNRNILNGASSTEKQQQQQQYSLADVQLKHERTTSSVAVTVVATQAGQQQQKQQQQQQTNVPLGSDGEPIKLPDNLESLPRADSFPSQRHRWNTNEEIAAILISFDKHSEWQSKEVRTRPKSGSLLLYSRKKVRYRRDGYCWKKRKDGKTTREDHMKLKVQGTECIYGCYVHSAILPTFHRRCYWLLQNPDIVLVHYLNVPYPDDNKMAVIAPSITLWGDKKEWTKEELVSQLKPMLSSVTSDDDSDSGNDIEISTAETVESIVCQLMEKQRLSRQAALVKQLDCGCADSNCIDGKSCSHPVMRRTGILKSVSEKRATLSDSYNHATTSTPNVVIGPKLYSRWPERRRETNLDNHHYQQQQQHQQLPQEAAIKFQIIQPQHNEHQQQHTTYQQQQQQTYRQHSHNSSNNNHATPHHQLMVNRNNLIIQHQQQQQQQLQNQQQQQNSTNFNQAANNQNNQINLQRFVANHSSNNNHNNSQLINNNRLQIAKTTITATHSAAHTTTTAEVTATSAEGGVVRELIGNPNHISSNSNNNANKVNHNSNQVTMSPQQQQQQQQQRDQYNSNAINNNSSNNNNNNNNFSFNTSISTNTSTAQQQELYKIQQQQQSNALSSSSSSSSATTSNAQPMCMSPEHQPSTPINGNNSHTLQQHSSNNSNIMQTSCTSSSSSSSPMAATSSSCHSSASPMIDDNVINPKQSSLSPASLAATTTNVSMIKVESNENQNTLTDDGNDFSKTELPTIDGNSNSSSNNIHGHSNFSSNSNNSEYNRNSNKNNSNGCHTLSASHDNSTIEEIETPSNHDLDNSSHTTIDFESMDTNIGDSGASASTDQHGTHTVHNELHDTLGFFNETLDLSQEDIQRTLIANLPFDAQVAQSSKHDSAVDSVSITHNLEYVANCADSSTANDVIPLPSGTCEADDETDDVFVNLDAFDMLVEFPDLDLDDKQALSHASLEHASVQLLEQQQNNASNASNSEHSHLSTYEYENEKASRNSHRKLLNICDFSPEWSYPEGGVKVLVAGPWTNMNTSYTVLFDSLPVPTMLVQEGVLRCYCPAHEVGFATLQVSCDGYIVSNSVMFEYKLIPSPEAPFDVTSSDSLYKFTLLNRLSSIDEKMQIKSEVSEQQSIFSQANFEEKLVNYCHQLMKGIWRPNLSSIWSSGFKGMSLLHLAAALGYSKLVSTMLNWRTENPNFILETEIDALSQDVYGYTPMTWACARGHIETVLILYKWNQNAMKIKNYSQQTPLDVASVRGHKKLLTEVYRLEYECNKKSNRSSLSSLALNLHKYDLDGKKTQKIENNSIDDLFDDKLAENIFSGQEPVLDTPRSHDGVFLRPVPVSSNQSPPNYSRYSKRSSVDSGINMDIRSKPGKSLKDISRLQSFDVNENFSLAADSPLDTFNATSATSSLLSPLRKMDFALCEVSTGDSSPLPNKEHDDDSSTLNNDDDISEVVLNIETNGVVGDSDAKVLTLAEHIIAAMPERIKNEADEMMVLGSPMTETLNSESSGLNDSFMDPLLDSLPNTHFDSDFSLDFNDHSYRYHDVSTPCSSLSPASSGPLQSPASYSLLGADPSVNSPSPPPSTKQLTEFLHASSNSQCPFEADFSRLTLTDSEQRELYEAAKCIQKAYRSYKGRQKLEEQNKERSAAIVIQNYYRRYKQYAYYRQMTSAALVIQHGYRSYCRHKRFKKSQQSCGSQNNSSNNSQCLSSYYDHYKSDQQHQFGSQPSTPKETSPSGPLKRTYSQSTQNQAARKIQQFMRQSRIKLQKERAEKEKLVHQRRAEYLQSLQFQGQQETAPIAEPSEYKQHQEMHTQKLHPSKFETHPK